MAAPTINFLSYNPTGLDNEFKAEWTRDLMKTFDTHFVSIQEHFKKNVGNFFDKNFSDFHSYVEPATRNPFQDKGRPKGGLAQLQTCKLQLKSSRITNNNSRIQAQLLHFPNITLL